MDGKGFKKEIKQRKVEKVMEYYSPPLLIPDSSGIFNSDDRLFLQSDHIDFIFRIEET